MWTRVTWHGLESDSSHKYDYLQLDFDFNANDSRLNWDLSLLTRPDLIPSPSPNIPNDVIKKVCSASTLQLTDYSLNRTSANQIVPAEKKLHVAVQRNVNRWIQTEALERWYLKLLFSDIKSILYQQKNGLQLAKHAGWKLQTEEQQLPTLFDIWSCTKNGKSWIIWPTAIYFITLLLSCRLT